MIVRNVDVNDLSKFDFFNDAKDTIDYLHAIGQFASAERLQAARDAWLTQFFKPTCKSCGKKAEDGTEVQMRATGSATMYRSHGAMCIACRKKNRGKWRYSQ